jgi:hypothetical protein
VCDGLYLWTLLRSHWESPCHTTSDGVPRGNSGYQYYPRYQFLFVGYLLDFNISLMTSTYKIGVKTYMYTYKIGFRPIHIPTR